MSLPAGSLVRVANQPNGGVAVLTGTTIGTLGSNTNGTTIETAGTYGSRVISLTGTTDDTVTINVFIYILRGGSTVIPLGLVNVPVSSGNTFAARFAVDFLNGTNIPGLPLDNTGRQYIPLLAGDVLRATTLANLSATRSCFIQSSGLDYLAP
jgi:hypothetical protein